MIFLEEIIDKNLEDSLKFILVNVEYKVLCGLREYNILDKILALTGSHCNWNI